MELDVGGGETERLNHPSAPDLQVRFALTRRRSGFETLSAHLAYTCVRRGPNLGSCAEARSNSPTPQRSVRVQTSAVRDFAG